MRNRSTHRPWRAALALALAVAAGGCAAQVGDACKHNQDCGDQRICDVSQPEGYCTVQGCTQEECPTESICVEFSTRERFCMRACEVDTDCRDGYFCVQGVGPAPFCNSALPGVQP